MEQIKQIFQDYQKELVWIANTEAGRALIGNKTQNKITKVFHNGYRELVGIQGKNLVFDNHFFWDDRMLELAKPITKIEIFQEAKPLEKFNKYEAFLHFAGLEPKISKFGQIYLYDTSFSTFLGGAGRFDRDDASTWATTRDAAAADQSFASYEVESELSGSTYRIQRVFLPVDTSSLNDTDQITLMKLNFNANYEGGYSATVLHMVQTTQATTSSRVLGDWDLIAGIPGSPMTSGGSVVVNNSGAQAKTITGALSSPDTRTWIIPTGETKLALVAERDQANTAPTGAGNSMWATVTSPELVVTQVVPSTGGDPSYAFMM